MALQFRTLHDFDTASDLLYDLYHEYDVPSWNTYAGERTRQDLRDIDRVRHLVHLARESRKRQLDVETANRVKEREQRERREQREARSDA